MQTSPIRRRLAQLMICGLVACACLFSLNSQAENASAAKLVVYVQNLTSHILTYDRAQSHVWDYLGYDGFLSTTRASFDAPEHILPGGIRKVKAKWGSQTGDYSFNLRYHWRTNEGHGIRIFGDTRQDPGSFTWEATKPTAVNLSVSQYSKAHTRLWATVYSAS